MSRVAAITTSKAEALAGELLGAHDFPELGSLLAAERKHSTRLWTVLNELRLHGELPAWARELDAGTGRQWEAMMQARADLDRALAEVLGDPQGDQQPAAEHAVHQFFAARYRNTTEG
jgi:hypothetical protein